MSFKEQIANDLDNVFLNTDEFAEIHRIEGKQVAVVIDNDRRQKLKQGQILGLVEADMLIMGKAADFPKDLDPGRPLNVDGRELLITDSGEDMGLVEVALSQNRTG
jgi:hypothetical protein